MAEKAQAKYTIVAEDDSDKGWRAAIARADSNGKRLKSTITSAFAGVVSASLFTSQIAQAIEFGDEIGKLSVKLGTNAKATSEVVAIAKAFDIEIGSLSGSLRTMQVGISQAAAGNKSMLETFKGLGVSVGDLRNQRPEQQFETIGEAIAGIKDPADRARAATELFGRSGSDLLPMFEQGAEGIRKARAEVQQFGTVINDLDVRRLQEADDALKRLKSSVQGLSVQSTAFFGPFIAEAADATRRLLGGATELEKIENQLRILREADNSIPVFFNFGFIEDAGVVMGPEAIRQTITDLEDRVGRLRRAGLSTGRGSGGNRGHVRSNEAGPTRPARSDFSVSEVTLSEDIMPARAYADWLKARKALESYKEGLVETGQRQAWLNEQIAEALERGAKESDEALEENMEAIQYKFEQTQEKTDEMSEFAKAAAQSMHGAFSDFFFDPFEGGLEGMGKSFANVIRRMLADAAATKLLETLFDSGSGAGGGGTGWAALLKTVFGTFGGGKAEGGPLQSGKWYIAGERGPEPIWGGGAGAFAAGYGGGGSAPVTVNYQPQIDARGASSDFIKAMPEILRRHKEDVVTTVVAGLQRGKYGRISSG